MYNTDDRHDRADDLGPRLGWRRRRRRQGQRLRLVDLHRRRGAAPDDQRSRISASRTRTSSTTRSSTAAIDLLEQQRDAGALYWGTYSDQVASYAAGDVTVGTSWQFQVNLMQGEDQPIAGVLPDEGSTGWSDTWMIATSAKHPNCMYMWMDHMASAEANGQATVWFGEAPTSQQACDYAETHLARSLRADARDRRGLLRQDLVLEHAAGRLRRRRRGDDLQGPGRLGRGLDHAPRRLIARPLPQRVDGRGLPGHRPGSPSRP